MARKEYQPDPVRVAAFDDLVNKGAWTAEDRAVTLKEDRDIALKGSRGKKWATGIAGGVLAAGALTGIGGLAIDASTSRQSSVATGEYYSDSLYGYGYGAESLGEVKDMKVGESAWTVPWAMTIYDKGQKFIDKDFDIWSDEFGTANMLVTKTQKGFEVELNCDAYKEEDYSSPSVPLKDAPKESFLVNKKDCIKD